MVLFSIRLSLVWAKPVRYSLDLMLVHSIEIRINRTWNCLSMAFLDKIVLVRAFKNAEAELFYIAIFVSIVTILS